MSDILLATAVAAVSVTMSEKALLGRSSGWSRLPQPFRGCGGFGLSLTKAKKDIDEGYRGEARRSTCDKISGRINVDWDVKVVVEVSYRSVP